MNQVKEKKTLWENYRRNYTTECIYYIVENELCLFIFDAPQIHKRSQIKKFHWKKTMSIKWCLQFDFLAGRIFVHEKQSISMLVKVEYFESEYHIKIHRDSMKMANDASVWTMKM